MAGVFSWNDVDGRSVWLECCRCAFHHQNFPRSQKTYIIEPLQLNLDTGRSV